MTQPSHFSLDLSRRWGMRAAVVMMGGLGVLSAFGCSSAATDDAAAPEADPAAAEQVAEEIPVAMEYSNGKDMFDHKSVLVTDESLIGEGAQFVNGLDVENTYIYKGFAHGDNNHYSMYSLYTELITDGDGVLTAVNLTSANDTWANKWGALGAKPTIVGTLPEGVSFDYTEAAEGDDTTLTFDLTVEEDSEAAKAGYVLNEIYLYDVQDDGTTVGTDVEGKGGRTTHNEYDALISVDTIEGEPDDDDDEEEAASSERSGSGERSGDGSESGERSGHGDSGSSEGSESGERSGHGDSSEGSAAAEAEAEAAPANVSFDEATETLTVEDGAYNLAQVRYQFGTEVYFDEYIVIGDDANAQAYVDANVTETDRSTPSQVEETAVTNRNKWTYSMLSIMAQREFESWATTFVDESLYTGGNDGEIGDIDTISGATKTSVPFQSALNQAIEAGYVTGIGEHVQVTIDGGANANDGIDATAIQQDQTTVTRDEDGNYVLTVAFPAGIDERIDGEVQHAISPTAIDLYALEGEDLGTLGIWNLGKGTSGYAPVASYADSSKEPGDVADEHITYVSDWDYPYNPTLTVTDPSVTHVVVTYAIGHETLGIAYDLAAMEAAQEVQAAIDALDANDAAAVAAAREAYDALTNDVKGTVGNYDKLLAAEGK